MTARVTKRESRRAPDEPRPTNNGPRAQTGQPRKSAKSLIRPQNPLQRRPGKTHPLLPRILARTQKPPPSPTKRTHQPLNPTKPLNPVTSSPNVRSKGSKYV